MKTWINFLVLAVMIISSCQQPSGSKKLEAPADIPAWVEEAYGWNWYDQKAYEQGRIDFNDDSSMMIVGGPRVREGNDLIHEALVNGDFEIRNVIK